MSDVAAEVLPERPQALQLPPAERSRAARVSITLAIAYLAFWQITPRIPVNSLGVVLLTTLMSLALAVWLPAQLARSSYAPSRLVIHLVVAALLIVPLMFAARGVGPHLPWSAVVAVPGLSGVLVIWLAATGGSLLALIVRSINMLPPIAAVLALVDIWTVFLGGPVQKIMESNSPIAQTVTRAMTVPLPAPKPVSGSAAPYNVAVGFADFLFIAFFVSSVTRFVPDRRTYRRLVVVLVALLCAYMLVVFKWGIAMPALVPMAVVMLALHWRHFRYERSEVFALLYAALVIGAIVAIFWWRSREPEDSDGGTPVVQVITLSAISRDEPFATYFS